MVCDSSQDSAPEGQGGRQPRSSRPRKQPTVAPTATEPWEKLPEQEIGSLPSLAALSRNPEWRRSMAWKTAKKRGPVPYNSEMPLLPLTIFYACAHHI